MIVCQPKAKPIWANPPFQPKQGLSLPKLAGPVGTVRRITTGADRTAKSTTCTL